MGAAHSGVFAHAVFVAHDIGFVGLHTHGVGLQIVLVVGAVLEPPVGDGQVERRVGVGQHGDPAVGVHRARVVDVGADVDLLDAEFGVPVGEAAGQLALPAPRGGLLVAAPEQQQLAVLGHVVEQVALLALAYRFAAPEVLAAPPPAFPAVGLADLQGVAAPQRQQLAAGAVAGLHHLVLAVLVALIEKGGRAVLLLDAVHLADDGVQRLVPGDAHVLALAPVLRVALAVGVPVDPLHGIADAGRRVDPLLVGDGVRRDEGLHAGLEGAAPHFHLPRVHVLLGVVLPVVVHRTDAHDLAVLDVHHRCVRPVLGHSAEADVAHQRAFARLAVLRSVFRHSASFASPHIPTRTE